MTQTARHSRFSRLEQQVQHLRASLSAERARSAKLLAALELQRREALTDPLTGLCNRRAMDQRFGELWSEPEEAPLAILVLDIDFFKRINDTYGHADGDWVIRWVAATLCRCIRAGDSAFRYGGEEFLVLLPDTTLEGAIRVAESIRGRIEDLHLAFPRHWQVPLTVSLGVAARRRQDDPLSLFERADRALYQAKRHGRNRVVHENCLV
jgi:diguanylate cyclase